MSCYQHNNSIGSMEDIALMDIKNQIRQYISENLTFDDSASELDDEESFQDTGIVDSTGVMELVMFIEESYSVEVEDHEITPENFDSIANLAAFVQQKKA